MKTKLKIKQEKGITLIALVITIVVLLILAGVSISLVLNNNGVISKAKDAKYSTEKGQAQDEVNLAINYLQIEDATSTLTREDKRKILEDELRKISADSSVSISGLGYKITHKKYDFFVDEDLKISSSGKTFNAVEWDKKAAPEDIFIWGSNDPNNSEYGTVVGYTDSVDNYPVLRYPSRCTKLGIDNDKYTFYEKYSEGQIFLGSRDITANIEKIELPSTVTEIGKYAFNGGSSLGYNFENLKEISIPDSVTTIGYYAFSGCTGLTEITIPNNVKNIGYGAFIGCTGLTDVKIPDSVTNIGGYAFSGCTGLTDVKIPDSVKTIGTDAFRNVAHITYAGNATGSPWGAKSIGKN